MLARLVGTSCAAASSAPSASPARSWLLCLEGDAAGASEMIEAASTTPVATHVTGSPHSPCRPNATAIHDADRPASTQGTSATDHARFGRLIIDTTGPDSANTHAPNAAAGDPASDAKRRRRNRYMPAAAIGSGSATQRLNDTTSEGTSRIASVIGITIWLSASAMADCPAATYGSHHGACPDRIVCRSHRCRDQKKNDRSRT